MSEKNSFWEWLGYTGTPNWGKARGLGGFVGATALLVALALFVASIAIIAKFVFAAVSLSSNSEDIQNLGLLLGAIFGAPFVAWRSLATKKQADVAEQVHIAEQISSAVSNLNAYRSETKSADTALRTSAALSLQKIALASPKDAEHILRILLSQITSFQPQIAQPVKTWDKLLTDNNNIVRSLAGTGKILPADIQQLLISIKTILDRHPFFGEAASQKQIEANEINLSFHDLDSMSFAGTRLLDCEFLRCSLKAMDFSNCFIVGGDFQEADLSGANLDNAMLHATFDKCLFGATRMEETTFMECSFNKTAFYRCDFSKLKFVSARARQQFNAAILSYLPKFGH